MAGGNPPVVLSPTFSFMLLGTILLVLAFLGTWIGLAAVWTTPTSEQKEVIAGMNWAFKVTLGGIPGLGLGKMAR